MSTVLSNNLLASVGDVALVSCTVLSIIGANPSASRSVTFSVDSPNATDVAGKTFAVTLIGTIGVGAVENWSAQPIISVGSRILVPMLINTITGVGAAATVNVTPQAPGLTGGVAMNIAGSQVASVGSLVNQSTD